MTQKRDKPALPKRPKELVYPQSHVDLLTAEISSLRRQLAVANARIEDMSQRLLDHGEYP